MKFCKGVYNPITNQFGIFYESSTIGSKNIEIRAALVNPVTGVFNPEADIVIDTWAKKKKKNLFLDNYFRVQTNPNLEAILDTSVKKKNTSWKNFF